MPKALRIERYKLESLPLYQAIKWYLKCTPFLEHFESVRVPRVVHLLLLLSDLVPDIRPIKIETRADEGFLDSMGKILAEDLPECKFQVPSST